MRDGLLLWGATLVFLLAAVHTVAVRQEVYRLGRELGVLEREATESRRRNDNLELERERLRSPSALVRRAREAGITLVAEESR